MSSKTGIQVALLGLFAAFVVGAARADPPGRPGEGDLSDAAEISILLSDLDRATGSEREALVQEATLLARSRVARLDRAVNTLLGREAREDATVDWFEARLELAEILGERRGRPLLARLGLGVETDEERDTLAQWLAESLGELDAIHADLTRRLKWAESSLAEQAGLALRLERVLEAVLWRRAFTAYDLAASTTFRLERRRLIDVALADIEELAAEAGPGRRPLQLLKARCLRDKGRFEDAADLLSRLARDARDGEPLDDVLFELALTRIDAGAAGAVEAIEDYQALSPADTPRPLIEVRSAMLHERLCRRRMEAAPEARGEAVEDLAAALSEFLGRNPSEAVREPIAELFARHWAADDAGGAPAPVLVLLAEHQVRTADVALADRGTLDLADSERQEDREQYRGAALLAERAKADSGGDRTVAAEALWLAGSARLRLGENGRAGDAYKALSSRYPAHRHAKRAGLIRAKMCADALDHAVALQRQPPPALRLALADSLEILARNWDDDPAADEWRIASATQYSLLADEADRDADRRSWRRSAMRMLAAVPEESPLRIRAEKLSLGERYRLARRFPPPLSEVQELADELEAFSRTLGDIARGSSDDAERNTLNEWGCLCELRSLVLRDTRLGDETAQSRLASLGERWPGCEALREAGEYLFLKALAEASVAETAGILAEHVGRHGQTASVELVESFLDRVHSELEYGGAPSGPTVKALYLRWAEWLYRAHEDDADRSHVAARFLADALSRQGDADAARRALRLYEQLEIGDAQRLRQEQERVRRKAAALRLAVRSPEPGAEDASQLEGRLEVFLDSVGLGESGEPAVVRARTALQAVSDPDSCPDRAERARSELLRAVDDLAGAAERAQPLDVELVIGRARCLRALNRLSEAISILTPLCSGLPRDHVLFWVAQVERAECIAATDAPNSLAQLLVLVRQLRALDPTMGRPDLLARFDRLAEAADRRLQALEPGPEGGGRPAEREETR